MDAYPPDGGRVSLAPNLCGDRSMPMTDLDESEIETIIYALGIALADLKESVADPNQTAEDREEWSEYIVEIEEVHAKLTELSEAEAA